jgi:hypothetical protein
LNYKKDRERDRERGREIHTLLMMAGSTSDHQLPIIPRVKLGPEGFEVSALGLGCMGMAPLHGAPKPESEMIELIRYAVNSGVTFLDTADAYGPHTNEVLIGKVR